MEWEHGEIGDLAIYSDIVYQMLANLSFTLINAVKMEWSTIYIQKSMLTFAIIDYHDLHITAHSQSEPVEKNDLWAG